MKSLKCLWAGLVLLLAVPGLCWGANALIVHAGTAGIEADALANLTTHLVGKGYTVTPNVGVPGGSLATYKQIWHIRFNNATPLTASDNTAYLTFLQGGGSLFLMGENAGFATRNNSLLSFVTSAGGGNLTFTSPGNTETVMPPFNGPSVLATITFLAAGGAATPPGAAITKDASNFSAAIGFGPGMLLNATAGTLILVFDVNFLQAGADTNSQTFTDNLISYLNAPTNIGTPLTTAIPTLSEWALAALAMLIALFGAGAIGRRFRMRMPAR